MREPVRRLIANAGALPAKQLLRLGHTDPALFEPLSKAPFASISLCFRPRNALRNQHRRSGI